MSAPKNNRRPVLLLLVGLHLSLARAGAADLSPEAVEFFENKIRPVLAQDCYECHRTGGKHKGGLALDHRQALLDGGDTGPALVPGDPAKSLLLQAIRATGGDLQMPKGRARLDASVIADFEKWIRLGAPDPRDRPATEAQIAADNDWSAVLQRRKGWWSFQRVRPPNLASLPDFGPANHPVDRFLEARRASAGLAAARRAEPGVLLRRLSFALRGLPPAPAEIAAFSQHSDSGAYERLVDSFLASPQFGERWARHWMDWVRYADSHGSEGDALIPYSFQYRDYLIRALNADVPYDQLLREHLAGDLLPKPRLNQELGLNESALGPGHLRMVFHGFSPTDVLDEQVRFIDDQIGVVSKAFLGLTVSCARCHDHKFDPISQKDFYGWYGIFATCPPASVQVSVPGPKTLATRATLTETKQRLRLTLADAWLADLGRVEQLLAHPDEALRKKIEQAKDANSLLHPFHLLQKTNDHTVALDPLAPWRKAGEAMAKPASTPPLRDWKLNQPQDLAAWRKDGSGMAAPVAAGEFALAPEGPAVLTGIYPSGVYSHLVSTKDRGLLLSPRVDLDDKHDLWMLLAGDGGSVARYVVRNYPRDGTVFAVSRQSGGQWRWVKLGLDYWQGDRIHVELSTAADQPVLADVNAIRSWFGVREVVITRVGDPQPGPNFEFSQPLLETFTSQPPTNTASLASGYAAAIRFAVSAWRSSTITDVQALLLDQLLASGLLPNQLESLPTVRPLLASYREGEASLPVPVRAPGVVETEPAEQPLFLRGDHKYPAAPVARHFLDAIEASPYGLENSGRLRLAEDMLHPDNPLTTRVIVNRVWHHLFGRGLVGTPDNFGRLGQEPTHPELLDYLAGWFVEHHYSIKALVRFLVTSEAWQSASDAPAGAVEKDPDNRLLSHFSVRRLEAEAVRDALLRVSGDLQSEPMFGPYVTGRSPRRSVYLRVKRNELDPFLAAFDAPVPASTKGQRDVTNVPAQSLALLNDPFVLELAQHWADRLSKDPSLAGDDDRIAAMFLSAMGRPASTRETEQSREFLRWMAGQKSAVAAERDRLESSLRTTQAQQAAVAAEGAKRVLAQRAGAAESKPAAILPAAASWDFSKGLDDQVGGLPGQLHGGARLEDGWLILNGRDAFLSTAPFPRPLKAKTLEAWVRLDNLSQQGGGVLSVQTADGGRFDAIVFGERESGRWMAGSEGFVRTKSFGGPAEKEAKDQPTHIVLVYSADGVITAYRNGQPYGKAYQSGGLASFNAGEAVLLLGHRHGEPGGNRLLAGRIRRATLYDRALSAEEVAALARDDRNFVSAEDQLSALSPMEREEWRALRSKLARDQNQLKALEQKQGLSTAWADLGLSLFNLKEFIYIR